MDKNSREHFLHTLDEAAALFSSDSLREFSDISDYEIKESEKPQVAAIAKDGPEDCFECDLSRSRVLYAKPNLKPHPLILFIAPYAECDRIFSPESQSYYSKWLSALKLEPSEVALSTIIKCPANSFSESYANCCKHYLRDEMSSIAPKNIVILSEAASRYMTRCRDDWHSMRSGRAFSINRIRSFCLSSPSEMINGSVSKRDVWEDLKAIAREIGIGDRIS